MWVKINNNTAIFSLSPLNSFLCCQQKKEQKLGCCNPFPSCSLCPLPNSHHGQFHLSFRGAIFPAQFLHLSQAVHSLGTHWSSLNIISNIWQSLWNSNEMRNQIYSLSRSRASVSEGCYCLGTSQMMGSCNYSPN